MLPIRRVAGLSFEEFYHSHAVPRVPVIIQGGAVPQWDMDHVVEVASKNINSE